ncbi:expressed protein [Phakopsora pachyrhizi]|uniref:Expressed protein n=1 Tax=Phakopsora pachyrhizi TaxID=170000 RepID=A0AAV0B267_PHAPC|nr:expressed protein [Phakopsora pachyrhizi]
MKIVAEDKVVRSKIKTLLNDWEKEKPISRELQPDIAINPINLFETRVNRLQEEYTMVCRAKEALDLEQTSSEQLIPVAEEITIKRLCGLLSQEYGLSLQSSKKLRGPQSP